MGKWHSKKGGNLEPNHQPLWVKKFKKRKEEKADMLKQVRK